MSFRFATSQIAHRAWRCHGGWVSPGVSPKKIHNHGETMRNAARLKMGYYPLPESEGVKLRSLLTYAQSTSVVDPCVGPGCRGAPDHEQRTSSALRNQTRCRTRPPRRREWDRDDSGKYVRRDRKTRILFAPLSELALRL
jgi:hypothetical protein